MVPNQSRPAASAKPAEPRKFILFSPPERTVSSVARRMNKLLLSAGLLSLWGCRDEQAGPKNRPPPQAEAPPSQPAPGPTPSNAAIQTLDAAPNDLTFKSGGTWANGAVQY